MEKGRTLDGVGELGREGDMGEGDIIENEVELSSPAIQVLTDETRHLSTRAREVSSPFGQMQCDERRQSGDELILAW